MWQISPTGELTVSQSVTSGGICPRHFVLDYAPAGDAWLRIANQDSQTIVSYLLGKNGEMTAPGDGLWQTVWASPATLELDGLCPSVITPPAPPPIWQLSEAGPAAAAGYGWGSTWGGSRFGFSSGQWIGTRGQREMHFSLRKWVFRNVPQFRRVIL